MEERSSKGKGSIPPPLKLLSIFMTVCSAELRQVQVLREVSGGKAISKPIDGWEVAC